MVFEPHEFEPPTFRRHPVGTTPLRREDDIFDVPVRSVVGDVDNALATLPGDQTRDDLYALALLAHATAGVPGHLVDVGAGQGRAAVVLGEAARATGRGRVFAVDLYPEHDEPPDDMASSLDSLLGVMASRHLLEWVLPHHGTGATFAQLMPLDFRCRLLLLEGAHACSDVSTDIFALESYLSPGGWLAVDDAFSSFPGASLALETLFRQRGHFEMARQLTPTLFVARKRG
jgi:Methyltransferase domain